MEAIFRIFYPKVYFFLDNLGIIEIELPIIEILFFHNYNLNNVNKCILYSPGPRPHHAATITLMSPPQHRATLKISGVEKQVLLF